jgi:large subunit ribosomal protein L37Ae
MAEKILGTAKRFGTRYGPTKKYVLAEIERSQRSRQGCPYCTKKAARWQSVGIYHCKACDAKFSSDAWQIKRKITFAEVPAEEEAPEED